MQLPGRHRSGLGARRFGKLSATGHMYIYDMRVPLNTAERNAVSGRKAVVVSKRFRNLWDERGLSSTESSDFIQHRSTNVVSATSLSSIAYLLLYLTLQKSLEPLPSQIWLFDV